MNLIKVENSKFALFIYTVHASSQPHKVKLPHWCGTFLTDSIDEPSVLGAFLLNMQQIEIAFPKIWLAHEVKEKLPLSISCRIKFGEPNDCWEWQSSIKDNYGRISFSKNGRRCKIGVHRFVFNQMNGEMPSNLLTCHHCDNTRCCNPNHLFAGTPKQNVQDKISKGRANAPAGSRNGYAKLNELQVVRIKERLLFGDAGASIARDYNVSKQIISYIKLGKTWKHV